MARIFIVLQKIFFMISYLKKLKEVQSFFIFPNYTSEILRILLNILDISLKMKYKKQLRYSVKKNFIFC
jgi:hypothetical protein